MHQEKISQKKDSGYYLKLLERHQIEPNFWCSEEYFEKAGFELKESQLEKCYWVEDENWIVFPPIDINGVIHPYKNNKGIWSDFNGYSITNEIPDFLDYEYIYDPKNFLNMEGKNWQIFRKNCRKWPKRHLIDPNRPFYSNMLGIYYQRLMFHNYDILEVLEEWLKLDENKVIEDDEVLMKYLSYGENRKVIIDHNGKVYAINIWDENYKYINYRYCICRPEPFLSEYARYLFYTDPIILNSGKLVNDGGVLDRSSLKSFKDKLNPIRVREVYSWRLEI